MRSRKASAAPAVEITFDLSDETPTMAAVEKETGIRFTPDIEIDCGGYTAGLTSFAGGNLTRVWNALRAEGAEGETLVAAMREKCPGKLHTIERYDAKGKPVNGPGNEQSAYVEFDGKGKVVGRENYARGMLVMEGSHFHSDIFRRLASMKRPVPEPKKQARRGTKPVVDTKKGKSRSPNHFNLNSAESQERGRQNQKKTGARRGRPPKNSPST